MFKIWKGSESDLTLETNVAEGSMIKAKDWKRVEPRQKPFKPSQRKTSFDKLKPEVEIVRFA